MSSQRFFHFLLFLHVCSSYLFYVRQAYLTGSAWSRTETSPFALSFLIFIIYSVIPLNWIPGFRRDVGGEDSGADEKRYQEARDELGIAKYELYKK